MPKKRTRGDRIFRRRDRRPQARNILVYELVGVVLGIYRRRTGMNQGELADEVDWPRSLVSKVERGDVGISLNQFDAIVEVLDHELQELGDHPPLSPWEVLHRVYRIGDALVGEGFDLVWATGLAWDDAIPLVRGRDLLELVREHWNVR